MLCVHESGGTTAPLHLSHDLQRQRGLARGLWPVDLHDAPAGQTAHAKRHVEPERAGGDGLDVVGSSGGIAQAHDRAFAELLFDLSERRGQRLLAGIVHAEPLPAVASNERRRARRPM